jgi:hypothetical protein
MVGASRAKVVGASCIAWQAVGTVRVLASRADDAATWQAEGNGREGSFQVSAFCVQQSNNITRKQT